MTKEGGEPRPPRRARSRTLVPAPEPEVLFSRPARVMDIRFGKPNSYDVTPNGERLLEMLPGGSDFEGQTTVVVLGDWQATVERR